MKSPQSMRAMAADPNDHPRGWAWRMALKPRTAVLCALVLTYVWRFHDLSGILAPFRLAALATLASWAYLVLEPRARHLGRMVSYPYMRLFYIWALWILVTAPFALSPILVWQDWSGDFFKTITLVTFVLATLRTLRTVHFLMATHIVGAVVMVFFYAKGGFSLDVSPVPMYDVNDMALLLNMTLPMVLFFALTASAVRVRYVLWGLAVVMAVCVLMTQSRGGFLTLGILILFVALRFRIAWWIRVVPPLALVLGFFLLPAPVQDRLSTLFDPSDDYNMTADEGRIELWKRGLGYLRENPITGVGMKNFPLAEVLSSAGGGQNRRRVVTHNSFLEVASETGLVGFALFMGMFATAFRRIFVARKKLHARKSREGAEGLILLADSIMLSLLAFCVNGFFLSLAYFPMIYVLFATAAGFESSTSRFLSGVHGAPMSGRRHVRVYPGSALAR